MPSVDDLRQLLLEDASVKAPHAAGVRSDRSLGASWPSRRILVPAAAAIVIAAVIAVTVTVRSAQPPGTSSTTSTAGLPTTTTSASPSASGLHLDDDFLFDLTIDPLPEREQFYMSWKNNLQTQLVVGDGHLDVTVLYDATGGHPPVTLASAETVDVNGVSATVGPTEANGQVWALNLPFGTDQWVTLEGSIPPSLDADRARQDLLDVAGATHVTKRSATLPFTLGWLPDGPSNCEVILRSGQDPYSFDPAGQVSIGDGSVDAARVVIIRERLITSDADGPDSLKFPATGELSSAEETTIDGHRVIIGTDNVPIPPALTLVADLGDGTQLRISVSQKYADIYDKAALLKILEQATFAPNLADLSTWTPAADALP